MKKIITLLSVVFIIKFSVAQQDAALAPPSGNFTSPVSGCALTAAENVTVRIFNYGPGSITTPFNVSYTINGGAPVTEVVPAPNIPQNTSYIYTFATKADLSVPGTYSFDATVSVPGDPTPSNDVYTGYVVNAISPSIGGSITAPSSVCVSGNSGTLILTGNTGNVLGWQYSTDGGGTWINISNTSTSQSYNNLTVETRYRAQVQNGACTPVYSAIATITIDPITVAGTVSGGTSVCVSGNSGTLTSPNAGRVGSILKWQYSTNAGSTWNDTAVTTNTLGYMNLTSTRLYRAQVASGSCSSLFSTTATVTVNPVTVGGNLNPASTTVCSGANGSITLSGHTGAIIRWEYSTNGGGAWTNIVNTATTQSYTNLTANTIYRARIQSPGCNVVYSNNSSITVGSSTIPGSIAGSTTVCSGSNTGVLTLSGNSGDVQYWEYSTNGGTTWTSISNVTTSQAYNNLTMTTIYRANVKNGSCTAANSTTATITVNAASAGGTTGPKAQVCSGSNSGNITLSGHVGTVQNWESSTDGITWTPIANVTTTQAYSNLTATTYYRATVKSGICASATSAIDTITVSAPSMGGTITSSTNVCYGNNSGTLTLTGNNGNVVRWEYSVNGGGTYNTLSNTTVTNDYLNLTNNTIYRAVVKNGSCAETNSATATVTVNPLSVGGTVSGSATVCSGTNTGTLTLSGRVGTVQNWESSTDNGATWLTIVNTTTSLTYNNINATTFYRALVKSGACSNDTSSVAVITVDPLSVGGVLAGSDTVCKNANSGTLTVSGYTGVIQHWEFSTDGGISWLILGNTTTTQAYLNLATTTSYRVFVKNGNCTGTTSSIATIRVEEGINAGTLSGGTTHCDTANSGTIVLSGHAGTIVNWESSVDGGTTWAPIPNSTASLSYTNLKQTTQYRAVVGNAGCGNHPSTVATVNVFPKAEGGSLPSDSSLCAGSSGTLHLTGYFGTITGWQQSTDNGVTWGPTPVVNTTDSLVYSNIATTVSYRVLLESGTCSKDTSTVVTLAVLINPIGGTIASVSVCDTTNNGTLTLTGSAGTVEYWQSSVDGLVWDSIANTTTTLNYTNLKDTTYFRAVLTTGFCGKDTSAIGIVYVNPAAVPGVLSADATACEGNNSGTLRLTGYSGVIESWQASEDNGATWTTIANTTDSLVYSNLTITTLYYVKVKSGDCTPDTSTHVAVTIIPLAVGGTVADIVACDTINSGSINLAGSVGNVNYWQQSTDGGTTWVNIPVTTTSLTYTNIKDTTLFRAVLSTSCNNDTSTVGVFSIGSKAIAGTLSKNDTVCEGANNDTLHLTGYQGTLQWLQSTDAGVTWTVISNTSDSLIYTNLTVTTLYKAVASNSTCTDTSNVITILVNPIAVGGTIANIIECDTINSGTINLAGSVGNVSYWQQSTDGGTTWVTIPVTTTSLTYSDIKDTTLFRAVVATLCNSDTSAVGMFFIVPGSVAGTLSESDSICYGSNNGTLHLTGYTGNLQWLQSTDAGATWTSIANSSDSLTYTNLTTTTWYRVIAKNNVCDPDSSNVVTLFVNPLSVGGTVSAGSSGACAGSNSGSLILTGYIGTIKNWEYSIDNGVTWTPIAHTGDTFSYSNILQTTEYRAVVQSGNCPSANSNSSMVSLLPAPVASFTADSVCYGKTTTFKNTSTISSGFIVNTIWSFGDGAISLLASPAHTYAAAGTYDVILELTSNNGCRDTSVVKVVVNALPPATIVSGSGKFNFCTGDSILLFASSGNYSYLWNGVNTAQNIVAKTTGAYTLQIADLFTGCSSTGAVTVTANDFPVISAGNDTTISLGKSVILHGSSNTAVASWNWYPSAGLDNASLQDPVAAPQVTTLYSLLVIDVNGCSAIDSVTIFVNSDYNVIVSNLITPNGDGFNDTWIIQNIESYPRTKVSILTRQGQEVYTSDSYDNTWNGTDDGKILADGTYYYVIKFEGDAKVLKGAVTILGQDK